MKRLCWMLALILIGTMGMGQPVRSQFDEGGVCMMRCAPSVGTKTYDKCLQECFSELDPSLAETPKPTNRAKKRASVDGSLHGYWLNKKLPCDKPNFDSFTINSDGASGYESACVLISSSKKGSTFSLKQRCEYYENEVQNETYVIRRISNKEITINGTRYKKCPKP